MKYISNIWKKKYIKVLAFVLVLATVIAPLTKVSATLIDDANDKINESEEALRETQEKMEAIEQQQAALQDEIAALDEELVYVILNLSVLEEDIMNAQANLAQTQADLAQAQIDEEKQYEDMKLRIQFMYERGDTAFISALLESKSMTDLLNRVEYINEIYDYDRELLTTYQETKTYIAELEQQQIAELAEMEELQANLLEEQERYETMIAQREGEIANFDSQLASAQSLAAKYQATINEQNEIIRQEEERIRKEEEERKRREEEERKRREEEERRRQEEEEAKKEQNNNNNTANPNPGPLATGKNGATGQDIIDFACQFIGNKYVYGGNDIYNGIDCSAYVRYVYAQFGYSLPRTSWEQRSVGIEVSYADAKPGDIICYSGHVALYMGNGRIVHASNSKPYPEGGIKISDNAAYRTIITVRRVIY